MELIKGNLLLFITLSAAIGFLILWAKVYDGPFRQEFEFYRRKNMQYEFALMLKLLGPVSIITLAGYYILGYFMGISNFHIGQIIFVVLTIFSTYIFLKSTSIMKRIAVFVLFIAFFTVAPVLMIVLIYFSRVQFDQYCNWFSLIMAVIDIPALYCTVDYWKKGDL